MLIFAFLRRRRVAAGLAISLIVGAFAAFLGVYSVSVAPPAIHPRSITVATAATYVMVDGQRALVTDRKANDLVFTTYTAEASLFATLLASDPVRDALARDMHISADQITARARFGTGGPFYATRAEQRANQILVANRPFKLEMQPDPTLPVIAIYGQAPSAAQATELTNGAVSALRQYIAANPSVTGLGHTQGPVIKQLGVARAEVSNSQTMPQVIALMFLVGFALTSALWFGGARVWRGFRRAGPDATPDAHPERAQSAGRPAMRKIADVGGDWPRTTRVMPWLVAMFLVVIWLIPFNDIQLNASLPFDLKFDRLVLPILVIVWVLSIAAGGPASPRVRLTRIHVGFLSFVAVVAIGIVLNAQSLNQALEFDLSTKKLTLLLSYGLMFAIIASSVRRSELRAFFKYSLCLSVVCAIGAIIEYRFRYNVFFEVSGKLFGKFLTVTPYDPNALDDLGRAMTRGPADHPLELVGMVTMMLPFAVVGIIQSARRRDRFLYGMATTLLLAAAVATDRKSALLAPLAAVLVVTCYYRRRAFRLIPLAFVCLLAVHVLSPGALGTVADQLNPNNLGVNTVSDRTADYDAIRSDLWSHLAFGRGYGSYDHFNYRVLDSDVLSRLVDTGVLGLGSFIFLLLGSIIAAARLEIRRGMRARAPDAIAVQAAAVAYLVLMFLFDVSSFPHVPYILLSLAGLLAVEQTRADEDEERAGTSLDIYDDLRAGVDLDHAPRHRGVRRARPVAPAVR